MSKSKVHILIISSWYPNKKQPFLGNFVQRQASLLSRNFEVTVVNTEYSETESAQTVELTEQDGFKEVRVVHPRGKGLIERRKFLEKALDAGLDKVHNVDLVIGHVVIPKGLQFVQAKKYFNCPLILVEHASYYRPEIRKDRSLVHKLILRKTRKKVDQIVAVSEFLRHDMHPDFQRHSISVIGNHVDTRLFNYTPKKKSGVVKFLHVSTMDEKTKNPEGILCACKGLKENTSDFQLTIVCDEDVAQWKHLATQFGLDDQIRFVGPLQWSELLPYYHEADAFLLFSDYESFSIVLAEAWMTGTPAITTPVGIAHNMSKELGILVDKGDKKMLASTMLDFIQNGRDRFNNQLIANHGKHYSDDAILRQWTSLIEKHVG